MSEQKKPAHFTTSPPIKRSSSSPSESRLTLQNCDQNPVSGPSTSEALAPAPNLPAKSIEDLEMVKSDPGWSEEPLDHEAVRKQWVADGRPPCPVKSCVNPCHPPPCDPERQERIRAERAAKKAAKKAAKAAVEPAASSTHETQKRKASEMPEHAGMLTAKRPQLGPSSLSSQEIAALGSSIALAASTNPMVRQVADHAARTLANAFSSPAPQRGGSSRGRGNGNSSAAARRLEKSRRTRSDRSESKGDPGQGASN
ncbi:MAG: hypothetical protein M1821_008561 [Bathelium mastoideum]|nr:MAG: hypothetical protein M1821_008561 [Bathelium mastoideum]